jgi:uncharacterized membrane protein
MAGEHNSGDATLDATRGGRTADVAPLAGPVASDLRAERNRGEFYQFATSLGFGATVLWWVSLAVSIAAIVWVGRVLFAASLGLRPPNLHFNHDRPEWMSVHGVFGSIAALIGPIQLSEMLRATRPHVHRLLGRIYVATAVVSVVASLFLFAKTDYLGVRYALPAGGVICLTCLLIGVIQIYRRDVSAHRRWMLRAYAALMVSISQRFYYMILSDVFDADFNPKYALAFWLACATNLVVVEVVVRRQPAKASTEHPWLRWPTLPWWSRTTKHHG